MTEDSTGPPTDEQRHPLDGFTDKEIEDLVNDLPGGQSVSPAARRLKQLAVDAWRQPSRPRPVPAMLPGRDDGVLRAPAQSVRPAPTKAPEIGWIVRKQDVTGISGVGVIGVYFVSPDGAAVYRWFGGPPQNQPKWEFYDNPGIDPFRQISGHHGNTELIPISLGPEE